MRRWTLQSALLACGLAICMLASGTGKAFAAEIFGVWLTEDKDSKIQFTPCGVAVCGRVVWLLKPADDDGNPFKDFRNPNASLRNRPILRLTIFKDLTPSGKNATWEGTVYNPDDGETYKTFLSVAENGRLEVKGCILGGLICDSEYWTLAND